MTFFDDETRDEPIADDGDIDIDDDETGLPDSLYQPPESEALLRRVADLIATARPMPLSASVMINKEEVLDLIEEAIERLPDELRAARWLLKEREEFLAKVKREGDDILDAARGRAERMVQRTEVVKASEQRARQIDPEGPGRGPPHQAECEDFGDQKLASFEIVLERTMKTVGAGRAKLQGLVTSSGEVPVVAARRRDRGWGLLLRPGPGLMATRRPLVISVADLLAHPGVQHAVTVEGELDDLAVVVRRRVRRGEPVRVDLVLESTGSAVVVSRHRPGAVGRRVPALPGRGVGRGRGRGPRDLRAPADRGRDLPARRRRDRPRAAGLRDAVLLALPLAPLCDEDCGGPGPEAYQVSVAAVGEAEDEDAAGRPQVGGARRAPDELAESGRDVVHRSSREPASLVALAPAWDATSGPTSSAGTAAMAVPKKKTSKSKSRSRRASAWKLEAPRPQPLPPLRRGQAARTSCAATAAGTTAARPSTSTSPLTAGAAMLPIAVDAMGGDRAPGEIVAGAAPAADELGVPVVLVGRPDELGDAGGLEVIAASEVIAMDADPGAASGTMKDSSLVRGAEAVRDGKASAMVSAGNTGATMASALLRMGRIKGVARPAIATPIPVPGRARPRSCSTPAPTPSASPSGWCSSPRWARCSPATATASTGPGSACCRSARSRPRARRWSRRPTRSCPTPALDGAGRRVRRQRRGPRPHVRRGRRGRHRRVHRQRRPQDARGRAAGRRSARSSRAFDTDDETRDAAEALMPRLLPLYDDLDPDNAGGAMLLGVDGVCIISHGSSSARAMVNAIRVAAEMVARRRRRAPSRRREHLTVGRPRP